jgi:tetratricopeptide (TPR) repeat protein
MTTANSADEFQKDGLPLKFLREFIDRNGGETAFVGLSTRDVKDRFIVPATESTKLSLCAQMKQAGDTRVQPATWFVSHAWCCNFLDSVKALEAFFVGKKGVIIIWLDLFSTCQHSPFSKPPAWWQSSFISSIGQIGQMVLVMTPWDNPLSLSRAWCLIELFACHSSGGHFAVALPPAERVRFRTEITERTDAFKFMLDTVNMETSECSRDSDKDCILSAVRGLAGGYATLDKIVSAMIMEWLKSQLQEEMARAAVTGQHGTECKMMTTLAGVFCSIGKYDCALPLYQKCLAKCKQVFGDSHPDTLVSLNNLALLYSSSGEYNCAVSLFQECWAQRKRTLGNDHPDTLASLNSLAVTFEVKGDYQLALPLYQECLFRRKRVLGDDHPDTRVSLSNLKSMYDDIDYNGFDGEASTTSIHFYEDCKTEIEPVLSIDNPDELVSLVTRANLLEEKGEYDCALPLFEECLTKIQSTLGGDHPDTIASLHKLANVCNSAGDYDRSLRLHEECLTKRKQLLGDDHPDTFNSLSSLAHVLNNKGEYKRALQLYQDCLTRRKHVLGDEHQDTLVSLNNLAVFLDINGEFDRALPLYEECVAQRKRILGDNHPDTLVSLNNLASLFYEMGQYDRALLMYEDCLSKRKRILGDIHPGTLNTQSWRDKCARKFEARGYNTS